MTKFYPEHDLSYVYRVEMEAQRMRSEEVGRAVGALFRAIGRAVKKLDLWFEGARHVNTLDPLGFEGIVTGRYHLPAVFTDAEKVLIKPANDDRTKRVA